MKHKKLITIKVFDNSISARIVGSKLEAAGIECYYIGENMSSIYPVGNIAVGGVKLQIEHKYSIKAQQILGMI